MASFVSSKGVQRTTDQCGAGKRTSNLACFLLSECAYGGTPGDQRGCCTATAMPTRKLSLTPCTRVTHQSGSGATQLLSLHLHHHRDPPPMRSRNPNPAPQPWPLTDAAALQGSGIVNQIMFPAPQPPGYQADSFSGQPGLDPSFRALRKRHRHRPRADPPLLSRCS